MISNNFWSNKNVLITGHTGFIGSWLCMFLKRLGAKVSGYALQPPTKPSIFELTDISNSINSIIGDIRDYNDIVKIVNNIHPEIVFHLAAQPLVRESYKNPIDTYSTNILGTLNILEALRYNNSIKAIINFTTDKCYENKEWKRGYTENDRLGGIDPYSSSKACSELVTHAYRQSFFNHEKNKVGIATVRAGNVIGGGDWAKNRLIPDCIRAFSKNEKLLIRYPNAIRPWQHVFEPISGCLLLAENLYNNVDRFSDAWNFGPDHNESFDVSWVVNYITDLWGGDASWEIDKSKKHHEANNLILDSSKSHNQLGWLPRWDIKTALEYTIKWYQISVNNPTQAINHSNEQISNYLRV
tara:strand:+ start:9032 stop:10096 length:1065 start_codon:yes stop_codon:yes gene_type:complete